MNQPAASTATTKAVPASPARHGRCVAGIFLFIALSLLTVATFARAKSRNGASADARERALQLFQKALAVSDIRATDSQPFALSGLIEIRQGHGKSATGTYSLLRAAPDRWREEIHFTNYSRSRVGGKDEYRQLRSIDYEILPVFEFDGAFGYAGELRHFAQPASTADLEALNFKQKKIAGAKSDCALLTEGRNVQTGRSNMTYKTTTTYCFNPLNSGLASMVVMLNPLETDEYSDFVAFAGKIVPSTITIHGNDSTVVFHMSQIAPLSNVDPKMFVPPPDAQEWDSCPVGILKNSKLVTQRVPIYPQQARIAHIEGDVLVYAVVDTDGRLHKMKVLASSSPLLSWSALGSAPRLAL